MRALAVTLVLAVALGCGGGDDPAPAPPPEDGGGSGGDTAGGGSGEAGGGGEGSGGGAGTGGGAGEGARIASSDGTVTFERLDADVECDALAPARLPDAVTFTDAPGTCAGATSDGRGNIAVAASVSPGRSSVSWDVFTPAGARVGSFSSSLDADAGSTLVPQPDGFQGLQVTGRDDLSRIQVDVVTFSGSGALRRTERATPPSSARFTNGWILAKDPLGGAALIHFGRAPGGTCSGIVSRYDQTGAPRGSGTFGSGGACRAVAAAVSSRGEALVVESAGGTAWLWWIAPDGRLARPPAPAGSFAVDPPPGPSPFLQPLIDGSIVANEGGAWTVRFPHLGDGAEPAPDWLASRPGFAFEDTRGARGYALLPPIQRHGDGCSKEIDLVAPSGRLCGRVTLVGEGGACTPSAVSQGWDGTVIRSTFGCRFRVWPGLLGGGVSGRVALILAKGGRGRRRGGASSAGCAELRMRFRRANGRRHRLRLRPRRLRAGGAQGRDRLAVVL